MFAITNKQVVTSSMNKNILIPKEITISSNVKIGRSGLSFKFMPIL